MKLLIRFADYAVEEVFRPACPRHDSPATFGHEIKATSALIDLSHFDDSDNLCDECLMAALDYVFEEDGSTTLVDSQTNPVYALPTMGTDPLDQPRYVVVPGPVGQHKFPLRHFFDLVAVNGEMELRLKDEFANG